MSEYDIKAFHFLSGMTRFHFYFPTVVSSRRTVYCSSKTIVDNSYSILDPKGMRDFYFLSKWSSK